MAADFVVERVVLKNWLTAIKDSFDFGNTMHQVFRMIRVGFDPKKGMSLDLNDGTAYAHIEGIPVTTKETEATAFLLFFDEFSKLMFVSDKKTVKFSYEHPIVTVVTESRYRLPVIKADDFMSKSEPQGIEHQAIKEVQFIDILDKLTPFAAKELARPELAGVSISDDYYVSTVGAYGAIHARVENVLSKTTIHPSAVKFLKALPKDILSKTSIGRNEHLVCVRSDLFFYTMPVPAVSFPYGSLDTVLEQIEHFEIKVKLNPVDLFGALRRVMLLDSDRFTQVQFNFVDETVLKLTCSNEQRGSISTEEVVIEGYLLSEGKTFSPFTLNLKGDSIDGFMKLFDENSHSLTVTILGPSSPIFVQQAGSRYMFFTTLTRG